MSNIPNNQKTPLPKGWYHVDGQYVNLEQNIITDTIPVQHAPVVKTRGTDITQFDVLLHYDRNPYFVLQTFPYHGEHAVAGRPMHELITFMIGDHRIRSIFVYDDEYYPIAVGANTALLAAIHSTFELVKTLGVYHGSHV